MAFFEDMLQGQNPLSNQEILRDLLDLTKSLESKTDISAPRSLAALHVLAKYLEKALPKLPEGSEQKTISAILIEFIDIYLRYMTSKDGNRAKQICEAIASLNMQRRETVSTMQKLIKTEP